MSQFNDPATGGGDRIDWDDVNGALLLFTVRSIEHDIPTAYGDSDAVKADVAVLDGPHAKTVYEGVLVFPRVLRSSLERFVGGKMVVGRLAQGEAKKGQSPPWVLDAASDAEKDRAAKYLEWRARNQPEPAIATTGGGGGSDEVDWDEEPF